MDAPTLQKLERIARNMPIVGHLTMVRKDCDHGEVYMALGRDGDGMLHGIWGVHSVARTVDFKPEADEEDALNILFQDATAWANECAKRGIYDEGWWKSGRV
jgi:hypothetical protein